MMENEMIFCRFGINQTIEDMKQYFGTDREIFEELEKKYDDSILRFDKIKLTKKSAEYAEVI